MLVLTYNNNYKWYVPYLREKCAATAAVRRLLLQLRTEEGRQGMPRPKKCRRVCCLPQVSAFVPAGGGKTGEEVVMTVDEYEVIRLIDNEGFSQQECSGYMNIARTTVQLIYDTARKKIAQALVEGRPLKIEGGNYRLCDGQEGCCGRRGCRRRRGHREGGTDSLPAEGILREEPQE
jgi:predicted DNA-binding protein (UPF0251 family)